MKIQLGLLCMIVTLSACGGGGGGGGGGESSSGGDSYGVRAMHAAIDAAPVDITSSASGSALVSQQFFAGEKGYHTLPESGQTLSITRTGVPGAVYGSFAVTASSEDRYTVLLYGDNQTFGLKTRLIKDEVPSLIDGSAIRVVNGVTRAADVTVTIGGSASEVVAFGQNTQYVPTTAGAVNVTVVRTSDGFPVQSGPIQLEPGKAYSLLLAGEVGYYVKGVLFADS